MANDTIGNYRYYVYDDSSSCPCKSTLQAPSPLGRAGGEVKTRHSTGLELSGERVQQRADLYFLHGDHLGTATYVTDSHGSTTQFFLNLPYGETLAEQNIPGDYDNPYKFNGKELDGETGLYYYGARYFDPRVSVWMSVDPLYEKTMDAYGYCYGNPTNLIDPKGLKGTDWKRDANGDFVFDKELTKENAQYRLGAKEEYVGSSARVTDYTDYSDGMGTKKSDFNLNADGSATNLMTREITRDAGVAQTYVGSKIFTGSNSPEINLGRGVDFITVNVAVTLYGPIGWNGVYIVDKYGTEYKSPWGISFGKTVPSGGAGSVTFNSFSSYTNESQMRNLLSGWSVGAAFGAGSGVNSQWSVGNGRSGISYGTGFYTPQIGVSANFQNEGLITIHKFQ